MTGRTWLPQLLYVIHLVCVYTARWDGQIREHLPPTAVPAYEALKTACDAFEAILYPIVAAEEGG